MSSLNQKLKQTPTRERLMLTGKARKVCGVKAGAEFEIEGGVEVEGRVAWIIAIGLLGLLGAAAYFAIQFYAV